MVRISPYKIKPEAYEKVFAVFYEVIGKKKDKEEFNQIFKELLSLSERIMIVKRIAIIFLLMKNIDYRNICEVLQVSNGTVSKYRMLMENSQGIVHSLNEFVKMENISLVFEELFYEIFAPGVYGIDWSAAWKNKISLQRKKKEGI